MELRVLAHLLLVCAVALAGCTGRKGDSCQEEDDCNDGLMCCKLGSRGLADRGTCQPSSCPSEPDAGPPVDAAPRDAFTGPIPCDLTMRQDCPDGQFCNSPDSCFGPGFCEPIPGSCPGILDPVCSCVGSEGLPPPDGGVAVPMTYQSSCFAHQDRRRVASVGACEAAPLDAGTTMDAGADAGVDGG